MKHLILFLLFISSATVYSQALTRGQVYNFAPGDTFIYYNEIENPGEDYFQYIVDVYKSRQDDTLNNIILYNKHQDIYSSAYGYDTTIHHGIFRYFNLTSTSVYDSVDSVNTCCFDSVVHGGMNIPFAPSWQESFCTNDSLILNRPDTCNTSSLTVDSFNNHFGYQCRFETCNGSFPTSYASIQVAERLGIVRISAACENDQYCNAPENYYLMYYHLSSGEKYGTVPGINLTALGHIEQETKITVLKRDNQVQVKIENQIDPSQLRIFNSIGEQIINQKLYQNITEIPFAEAHGIYLWQLTSPDGGQKTGKFYN